MLRLKGLLKQQAQIVLSSPHKALLYAVILALLPYCTWLSMTVVALVTLRKGERYGGAVLLAAVLVHSLSMVTVLPLVAAVLNSVLVFVPCYLAAYCLRISSSWQVVAALLFLLVILSSVIIQQWIPEWVIAQFTVLKSIIQASQPDASVVSWLNAANGVPVVGLANLTLGIQLMSAVISVWSALMTARSLQSQLYYPGGFAQELLSFRGNFLSLVLMLIIGIASWQWNVVALNVLPVLILFYLLTGLSLSANFFMSKKSSKMMLVALIVPLVCLPFVVLPIYILLGLLDSVFNLRLARGKL